MRYSLLALLFVTAFANAHKKTETIVIKEKCEKTPFQLKFEKIATDLMLPAYPDEQEDAKDLLGIDDNNNDIRDIRELENAYFAYPDKTLLNMLNQLARADYQKLEAFKNYDIGQYKYINSQQSKIRFCLSKMYPNHSLQHYTDDLFTDTPERKEYVRRMEKSMEGSVTQFHDFKKLESYCKSFKRK